MIHESPKVDGKIKNVELKYYINHYVPQMHDFSTFKNHYLKYARIQVKQTKKERSRVFYFIKAFVAFFYYLYSFLFKSKWILEGLLGVKASFLWAMYFFMVNWYSANDK